MKVICTSDTCKYNKNCRDCVYKGTLVLNDDNECECYEHYSDAPEYQTIYYRACQIDGNTYKRIAKGRKTLCNGFTLYYEAKDLTPETWCTEEVSGAVARLKSFQNGTFTKRIRDTIAHLPYKNVKDLPYEGDSSLDSNGGANARKD